jgi:hypothetical protein
MNRRHQALRMTRQAYPPPLRISMQSCSNEAECVSIRNAQLRAAISAGPVRRASASPPSMSILTKP